MTTATRDLFRYAMKSSTSSAIKRAREKNMAIPALPKKMSRKTINVRRGLRLHVEGPVAYGERPMIDTMHFEVEAPHMCQGRVNINKKEWRDQRNLTWTLKTSDGHIAGFALARPTEFERVDADGNVIFVHGMYMPILCTFRGEGAELFGKVLDYCIQQRCSFLELEPLSDVVSFYKRVAHAKGLNVAGGAAKNADYFADSLHTRNDDYITVWLVPP